MKNKKLKKFLKILFLSTTILLLIGIFFFIVGTPFSSNDEIEIKHKDLVGAGLEIVKDQTPYYVQTTMNYKEVSSYLGKTIKSKQDLENFALNNGYKFDEHKRSLVSKEQKCIFDNSFKMEFCVKESLTFIEDNSIRVALNSYNTELHGEEGSNEEVGRGEENHEE